MTFTPCAWWHQQPPTPLEALRITADSLERGEPVPPAAATIIAKALRAYLGGATDITGNLGLRPRRGGRHDAPLAREQRAQRDEGIRHVFALQDGPKTERAAKVAELLRTPPVDGRVTEADVMAHLLNLHRDHAGSLPQSARQVLRIVGDKPASD